MIGDKMYWKYFCYVVKHKWYVMQYCFKAGLFWRGIMHDMSKFLPSEFIHYARYFYGKGGATPLGKANFDKAWLLHIHRNPHHHQYWLLTNDTDGQYALEMPQKYGLEMIADWRGAGKAITGNDDIHEWYDENKDKMVIHPKTRKSIERTLMWLKH
jgi:hypothetical protein